MATILGLFHSYSDPSAALVADGRVLAFCEEERLLRNKHAVGLFPSRAVRFVLREAGLDLSEVDAIAQAWNCPAYDEGRMAAIYEEINRSYPTSEADLGYQGRHLAALSVANQSGIIRRHLRQIFGDIELPPIRFTPHHLAHASMAYAGSGMDSALVLTIDGSGDWNTCVWWKAESGRLEVLKEVNVPHSLGWFYSAITEYLGFQAYDGEYKVMGLAAYGKGDESLANQVSRLVEYDGEGGFRTDPMLLSRGPRRYSYYYPDTLADLFGRPPRSEAEEISDWHQNLAFETQRRLEDVVEAMARHWRQRTGIGNLVIAGGVGLNIKMNSRLFSSGLFDDVFVHPLCADSGCSIGGATACEYLDGHWKPERCEHVSLGPGYSDEEIRKMLDACKLDYEHDPQIERTVAKLISDGAVVGWFQGRMEAGPRALGNRSILGDPRQVETRDRVNAVIKFREPWRPFCPSMTREAAGRYLKSFTYAPFMIIAFEATETAKREIPAVVHVDGTARVQIVEEAANPRYHRLLAEFGQLTGVSCLLNTSFNVKGEPIVCTPQDAIRTFSATGLDALAIGSFLLRKPRATSHLETEQDI